MLCVAADGPRGSGKRNSIEGGQIGAGDQQQLRASEGLLQRAVRHAFLESKRRPAGLRIRLACFAIHRRQAYDMLAADAPAKAEIKRQNTMGERVAAYVDGLRAPAVRTIDEAFELIEAARAARMRLPMCGACANWTLELDIFWTIYL